MSDFDLFHALQSEALPHLRAGNIATCDGLFVEALNDLPTSPFHICRDLYFSNSPTSVAKHFDDIFEREGTNYEVRAAYTEINGFDINPDRWYFDVFTFEAYGGLEDLDWLSDWQSDGAPQMTLTGMEELQKVYASPVSRDPTHSRAGYICSLIVVARFQKLIATAVPSTKRLAFPLLATSHDFDFIAEFKPPGQKAHR